MNIFVSDAFLIALRNHALVMINSNKLDILVRLELMQDRYIQEALDNLDPDFMEKIKITLSSAKQSFDYICSRVQQAELAEFRKKVW